MESNPLAKDSGGGGGGGGGGRCMKTLEKQGHAERDLSVAGSGGHKRRAISIAANLKRSPPNSEAMSSNSNNNHHVLGANMGAPGGRLKTGPTTDECGGGGQDIEVRRGHSAQGLDVDDGQYMYMYVSTEGSGGEGGGGGELGRGGGGEGGGEVGRGGGGGGGGGGEGGGGIASTCSIAQHQAAVKIQRWYVGAVARRCRSRVQDLLWRTQGDLDRSRREDREHDHKKVIAGCGAVPARSLIIIVMCVYEYVYNLCVCVCVCVSIRTLFCLFVCMCVVCV